MKYVKRLFIGLAVEAALLSAAWFVALPLHLKLATVKGIPALSLLQVRGGLISIVLFMSAAFGGRVIAATFDRPSIHMIWSPLILGIGFLISFPLNSVIGSSIKPELVTLLSAFGFFSICGFPLWVCLHDLLNFKGNTRKAVLRGASVISGLAAEKALLDAAQSEIDSPDQKGIRLHGECFLPKDRETHHILIVGSPGSGKTQVAFPLLTQVLERGDRAIVWDVKGTYTQALYGKPGVSLLAPWDRRSIVWQASKDIRDLEDCKQAAEILIPGNPKELQPYFSNASREILRIVMGHLDAASKPWGWADLWRVIGSGQKELYRSLQQSDPGATASTHIGGDNKSSHDVYSSLVTAVAPLEGLGKAWPGAGESLRDWIRTGSGTLIIGGLPQRSVLAMTTAKLALRVMLTELLSMPNDRHRRVWLFLDELATLGQIQTLLDAFSLGREKGLCIVVGIQDIGKIEHLYGRELAKSMSNTFSTNIFLRSTDQGTSEWAAGCIGQQELREEQVSQSRGQSKSGGKTNTVGFSQGSSLQEVVRIKAAVLASEIAGFRDLEGLLRVPGWPTAKLQWTVTPIPMTADLVQDASWVSEKIILRGVPEAAEALATSPEPEPAIATRPVWKLPNRS